MDSTLSVKILKDQIKLRGLPHQGAGFFTVFYAVFRGFGILLSSSNGGLFGLFSSITSFFTAKSVLYIGCEAGGVTASHIEAAVLSPSVTSMEAVCNNPEGSMRVWGSTLARSLSSISGKKDTSKFRIELSINVEGSLRDRDLVVHYLDDLFPPAPTSETVQKLTDFLMEVRAAGKRLQFGGFYVLVLSENYVGTDLLLSGITATSAQESSLVYTGMIFYQSMGLPLWIFRNESMNPATLESQRTSSLSRLTRYPPSLQAAVKALLPTSSVVSTDTQYSEVLSVRVTPTDTLNSLFRLALGPYPREVLNKLGSFQPKYSVVIDKIRSSTVLKTQVRMILELLYDLALAAQRQ